MCVYLLALMAFLVAAGSACEPDTPATTSRLHITARLGPALASDARVAPLTARRGHVGPELLPAEMKRGTELRHAVCVGSAESLLISGGPIEGEAVLLVSFATGPAPSHWELESLTDNQARPILTFQIKAAKPGWVNHSIALNAAQTRAGVLRLTPSAAGVEGGACVGGIALATPAISGDALPNIILVSLDTLGAHFIGRARDGRSLTPGFDRLRRDSFVFDNTYAQYPSTLASHTSLFSGLYPIHHERWGRRSQAFPSLVDHFRAAGYWAAGITEDAFVGSSFGFAQAFDEYDDGASNALGDAPNTFARARKWLAQRGRDQRFFLFLHTYEVHAPYLPRDARALATANTLTPSDSREWDADRQWAMVHGHGTGAPLPADEVTRLEALYRGEIEYIDRAFGELLAYIDDEKIAENTILVVFSDHGDEFSQQGQIGHGFSLGNEVLHVPLFFRWPGHIAAGADAAPAEVLDILPTLLELSGIESPPALGGASLRARMQDIPAAAAVDFAFSEVVLADPSQCDSRSC
ncbi:MAG: sulfatase, partial [bacterium]